MVVPAESVAKAAASVAAAAKSPAADAVVAKATLGALDSLRELITGGLEAAVASPVPSTAENAAASPAQQETETIFVTQPCITTSGETFAIWLNVFYLAPLTYLFVMFFIRSYIRRSSAESSRQVKGKPRRQSNVMLAEKAGWDAARDMNREIYNNGAEEAVAEKANGKAKH